jgi:hypothetical protein
LLRLKEYQPREKIDDSRTGCSGAAFAGLRRHSCSPSGANPDANRRFDSAAANGDQYPFAASAYFNCHRC